MFVSQSEFPIMFLFSIIFGFFTINFQWFDWRALFQILRNKNSLELKSILESEYGKYHHDPENYISQMEKLGLWKLKGDKVKLSYGVTNLLHVLEKAIQNIRRLEDEQFETGMILSPELKYKKKENVTDVFVLMPFLPELDDIYDKIKSIVLRKNLTISRADDFFTRNYVMEDIWNAINHCKYIIADCTGRNPNVFYEIGMAHIVGKPVILLAQKTEDIPFDISGFRFIIYDPDQLRDLEIKLDLTLDNEISSNKVKASLEVHVID